MSACEKCWADAAMAEAMSGRCQADEYRRLLAERGPTGCTPEQQAGPDATDCCACERRTVHQFTGECMACHRETRPSAFRAGTRVVYRPRHGPAEEGTVSSCNDRYVFVCYGLPGSTPKATAPTDLERVR